MSGETEKQVSGWTTDTLKEAMFRELEILKADMDKRFAAQEKNVETAFNAAKEAVIKSEIGVEKRSDAVYVTITKLQDALAAVMPRAEAEQRFAAQSEKYESLKTTSDTGVGKSSGTSATIAYIVTAVSLIFGAVGIILAFNN